MPSPIFCYRERFPVINSIIGNDAIDVINIPNKTTMKIIIVNLHY